ncbi:CDP-alcohol phosphatidyltransferase [Streptomyces sp. V2]|nr:CDP-alcohol phosphatidyltransferase [Streptomyces sp. V2]
MVADPDLHTGSAAQLGHCLVRKDLRVPVSTDSRQQPEPAPSEVEQAVEEPEAGEPPVKRFAVVREWRSRYPLAAKVVWWTGTVLAVLLLYTSFLLPVSIAAFKWSTFIRLPGEAIVVAALLIALPRKARLVFAVVGGIGLAALTVVNGLEMGYRDYLGRSFNPVLDWELLDDAKSYVADSSGRTAANLLAIGLVVLVVLLFAGMVAALVRVGNILARDVQRATRGTLLVGTAWITCTILTVHVAGIPFASYRAAAGLNSQRRQVEATLKDEAAFKKIAKSDKFGNTPPAQLVPDLRGKDMLFTFIESYGRSAIEDPIMAPGVDKMLTENTAALAKIGFHAKSGWLTSSTYGGGSWFGHSTTMSGLWIDNQQRYRTVMASDHLSLTKAFQKTGAWDTVGIMPGVQKSWPEQKYYGLDKVYNAFQMGYQGPKFSWSTMPDQYALESYQRLEHGKKRDKPLMAEIILTSSHMPWAPIPQLVNWEDVGDGSVFDAIQKAGKKSSDVYSDDTKAREEYGKSVQYSVTALTQWMERYADDDTVLVFLGDHQPNAKVSGTKASRDVPISIVAKDPKVLQKVADWNWTDGLKPAHDAPVWKMDQFRDRFLTAYGSTPHPKTD